MKFKSLHEKVKRLDNWIDEQVKNKRTNFVVVNILKEIVSEVFPEAVMINFGLHKVVFHLRHKSLRLVLKVGKTEGIERDQSVQAVASKLETCLFCKSVLAHQVLSSTRIW